MNDSKAKPKRHPSKNKARSRPKPNARRSGRSSKKAAVPFQGTIKQRLFLASIEIAGLLMTVVSAIIVLLGYSAERFAGTDFLTSLLPFASGVLLLILAGIFFLMAWWRFRRSLRGRAVLLTPALAAILAFGAGKLVLDDRFALAYGHFRTLVGGKQEVRKVTLAHQVYAAYRRHGTGALQKMVDRGQAYDTIIQDAARSVGIDPDLLLGIAAAESSFIPRNSRDGGHGLFQITRIPKDAETVARKHFAGQRLSVTDDRHNAYLAAATFNYYLDQMNGDLFLGLLAYNIGPANGGLRFIMQQYGVTDFTTIQPYLQQLPRDYPIRVLSYALAFRLWRQEGRLPAYQEGNNAARIQRIGIPGLAADF